MNQMVAVTFSVIYLVGHVGTDPTLPRFNQYCRVLMYFAQGYNTVPPEGIEPRTSRL